MPKSIMAPKRQAKAKPVKPVKPKKKTGPAVAAGSAGPAEGPADLVAVVKSESFNAVHFQMIRNMKKEILEHPVFAGIDTKSPLSITADKTASGREAPLDTN